jgi:hypothetical protein
VAMGTSTVARAKAVRNFRTVVVLGMHDLRMRAGVQGACTRDCLHRNRR